MADFLTVHTETNGLTNGTNLLNQEKKLVKQVKQVSQNTKIVFIGTVICKH